MGNKLVTTRSGPVEYNETGEGKAVLVLHGGHSNSKDKMPMKDWDLSKYRFIIPSRPGYGNSPLNGHKTPLAAAELMVDFIAQLQVNKVIIYAISAGGPTGIALASRYPAKVENLILASAVSKKWLDENGDTYKKARKMFSPAVEKMSWRVVRIWARLFPGMLAKNFLGEFSKTRNKQIRVIDQKELITAFRSYGSGEGFLNDIEQRIEEGLLKEIQCPTLILHSKLDSSVPLAHAEHSHQNIPNSNLILFENQWGHVLWLGEEYKDVIKSIKNFLMD